ncbi:MAG: VanZ family protein [Candidatus Marinimicrobia bacterium]|nr:VanZ family protein [Candidatus Neomarinimicrobiota bacterium]MCF7850536.1 VanZ family protein [Candidatus Neomarinimicrobiota bacterium]MCF7904110.1 VanZ family protein [Candidatus Neomarinimicrobiota bacterium]
MAYQLKYYAPPIVYVLLILFLSSLNQNVVSTYSFGLADYILHGVEYHILGVTLIWAFYREKPRLEFRSSYSLAISTGSLIAMADEFYQSFIPTRYSTIEDVVVDVFGLILSVITFSLLMKIPRLEKFRIDA